MNILISSLGLKPEIIEETVGLFNYFSYDFYQENKNVNYIQISKLRHSLQKVNEVWLIATDQQENNDKKSTIDNFRHLQSLEKVYDVKFKLFLLDGVADIVNENDAKAYHDLALKVVSYAQTKKTSTGILYVSLACGRKTMSTDMLDAVNCFGCDDLFHILGENSTSALPFSLGKVMKNQSINEEYLFGNDDQDVFRCRFEPNTLRNVEKQKLNSQHFFTSYFLDNDDRNNFHVLYTLSKEDIIRLKNEKIGVDKNKEKEELDFLSKLPKTELHCHLGGVLSPSEMIDVARCYRNDIEACRKTNAKYANWHDSFSISDVQGTDNWKHWRDALAEEFSVCKGLIVAPLILSFENNIDELERLIYGKYLNEAYFQGIGIDNYETLGDLQGSSLLCQKDALSLAVKKIIENCKQHTVKYLELRCSPLNYTTDSFSDKEVMTTILEEVDAATDIEISIILIASRHSDMTKIKKSFEFAKSMRGNRLFQKYFRGFDLAGSEGARQAKDVRNMFLEAMRDCYSITIHAGETEDVQSVWQAVYELNSERIGHGLSLTENKDLMNKFLDRGICVEMCPSSNYQIGGFSDNYYPSETSGLKTYPLKEYLDNELKVCVNTDDPGISRTNITKELLKASRLTAGGLSKWEILQLLCNGFKSAFYPYKEKKALMEKAEKCVFELIKENRL